MRVCADVVISSCALPSVVMGVRAVVVSVLISSSHPCTWRCHTIRMRWLR